IAVYRVATTAARGASAIAGNRASPSLDRAFPSWVDNGTSPARYNVVTTICGPQPGRKPTRTPIAGSSGAQMSKKLSIPLPVTQVPSSYTRNPKITQVVMKLVSSMVRRSTEGLPVADMAAIQVWLLRPRENTHMTRQSPAPAAPIQRVGSKRAGGPDRTSVSTCQASRMPRTRPGTNKANQTPYMMVSQRAGKVDAACRGTGLEVASAC